MATDLALFPNSPRQWRRPELTRTLHCPQRSLRFRTIQPTVDTRAHVKAYLQRTSPVYAKHSSPASGRGGRQRQGWGCSLPPVVLPVRRTHRFRQHGSCFSTPDALLENRGSSYEREGIESECPQLPSLSYSASDLSLLRRPATHSLHRSAARVSDDMLGMLGNYLDLTPYTLGHDPRLGADEEPVSVDFYSRHFPLLMRRKGMQGYDDERRDMMVSRRALANRQTAELKRRTDISTRCASLERALTSLELEQGGGEAESFVTELREVTFDPRQWPWNAERYQK